MGLDKDGNISQHTEYIAFGEILFDEHKVSRRMPYLFNGKELDSETGLYYYGARYYDARVSLWLGTDPLSGYNPIMETEHYIDGQHNGGIFNPMNFATYSYTYQNPIRFIDPNGKQVDVHAKYKDVVMNYITVGYERNHNRYFYQSTGSKNIKRLNSSYKPENTWIGSQEYTYTIYGAGAKKPVIIRSQDLKKGKQYELPGVINLLYNPYNLEAYRKGKAISSLFKGQSDNLGRMNSWLELYEENKGTSLLGTLSTILQGIGTSLDVMTEMSIGKNNKALDILTKDVLDFMVGETMTKSVEGKIYDALGKPNYDNIKQGIVDYINKEMQQTKKQKE
ncbi:RHS repeat-associated core domain-containing protein [Riemerella anatipestifer]|nr:RHS repeat-associated core domain-containing protein [Riemerella anatipestifer]